MASRVTGHRSTATAFRRIVPGLKAPIGYASRKALQPMLKAARANAPVDSGDLKKSLAIKRDSRARKNVVRNVIGPRADYVGKNGDKPVKYSHVIEFGSADGTVKGSRWLTRAFEESKDETIRIFREEIGPAIEKQAAKVAAKRGQP